MWRQRRVLITAACSAAMFFSATGCHVRQPSLAEQDALVQQGYFITGIPPWVVASAFKGRRGGGNVATPVGKSGALFPPPLDGSPKHGETSFSVVDPYLTVIEPLRFREEVPPEEQQSAGGGSHISPIDRVERACPGVEGELREALTTEGLSARISRWERLLTRCPTSSDLWYWIGLDYNREGKIASAGRALERAVELDNTHREARALLEEVRRRLNTPESSRIDNPSGVREVGRAQ